MNLERFANHEFDIEVLPRPNSFIVLAPGLARGLGHRDAANMLRSIPEDEKGYSPVSTPGGDQQLWHLTEPGFYRVIGQRQISRIKDDFIRDQVDRFQRWIFHEVLPELRRRGSYSAPTPGNFPQPILFTFDVAAAHVRQLYGLPIDSAIELRERLTDAGVLKLTGVPCKRYRDLFWPVGRRFDIHAHALPLLAGRVARELYRLAEKQAGVQTVLELDALTNRAIGGLDQH
ncbi:Bro-N domain-containing protein [Streptomyces griseus]|uniref:BRO-N domain-containing protein n=1 Tax=Streptomyces griseus TaxID=1911 RepID=UPI0037F2C27E